MLLAVLSDLHANLQAWNAVLVDVRSLKADQIVCLGDIVGYGPNPAEVLEAVYANVEHVVLGNHDAAVCGKIDDTLFNDKARSVLNWTRRQLGANAARFLGGLPLSLDAGEFRCTHGDFAQPAAFNYIIDPEDALPSWRAVPHQLLFFGHSHCPGIFVLGASGKPHLVAAQDFELEEGKRYLVNAGSVGQPRDGEARASYCLYDTVARTVVWRRIPFDIDAYREALRRAGVAAEASYFLLHDPRQGRPPLRQILNFSPAKTPEQGARDVVEVREVRLLRRRLTQWKALAGAVAGVALVAAVVAGGLWWRACHRSLVLDGGAGVAGSAVVAEPQANLLRMPEQPVAAGAAIPGWRVELGDKRRQRVGVAVVDEESGLGFALASAARWDALRLAGPPVGVRPGMKLGLEALFRKGKGFDGSIALAVSLDKEVGGREERVEQFEVKEPNEPRRGGWLLARSTIECPAGATRVCLQIRGRFVGEVAVRDVRLYRKE